MFTLNDALAYVGDSHRYQIRVFLILAVVSAVSTMQIMGATYLYIIPPLLCNGIVFLLFHKVFHYFSHAILKNMIAQTSKVLYLLLTLNTIILLLNINCIVIESFMQLSPLVCLLQAVLLGELLQVFWEYIYAFFKIL